MKMQETKLVDPHLLDPAQTGLKAQEFEARLRSKVIGQDDAVAQVVRVFAPTEVSPSRARGIAVEAARRRFPPDFFNRIDKLVVFQTLGERELRDVLDLELKTLGRGYFRTTANARGMSEFG